MELTLVSNSESLLHLPPKYRVRSKAYTIMPAKIAGFILTILETRQRKGPHPRLSAPSTCPHSLKTVTDSKKLCNFRPSAHPPLAAIRITGNFHLGLLVSLWYQERVDLTLATDPVQSLFHQALYSDLG